MYESDGEKSTIKILNYNKAIKKNLKNALNALLDDEVILIYESKSEANKETIKIYSDNKSKYTTEYTYAFDL
ncbi:hypothetical protein [Mesoplasma melaleucae]|uniref:Uncharacterized protein n=1 Tax=Mesoplasma melaleucae TaxID=81459 RepID=A0A2K8NWH7_9MOLU|nr:hypothetical protein [Mesoplasma melaleucae]ATZ18190.1 hypothetical protein EMELA_v1c06830 [Mesoplasma melaleucae]